MTEQLADKKRVTNCLLSRHDKERRFRSLEQDLIAAAKGPKIEPAITEIRKKGLVSALRGQTAAGEKRHPLRTATIAVGAFPMTEQLADKKCVPCRGGVPPLKGQELDALHKVVPDWSVVEEHHLTREYKFHDFAKALKFVNRVGALAEEQGHHPDILLAWGKAGITLWTHKIDGLTESDFIMAAKIDRLPHAA